MGGVCTIDGREGPECTDNFQILHQAFEFFGRRFYSAEQAYQANKFLPDSPMFLRVLRVSPVGKSDEEFGLEVWSIGNSATTRPDWHSIKVKIMYLANLCKFAQNRSLAAELMATQGELEAAPSTWRWQFFNGKIMNRIRDLLRSGVNLHDEIDRIETMDGIVVQQELKAYK